MFCLKGKKTNFDGSFELSKQVLKLMDKKICTIFRSMSFYLDQLYISDSNALANVTRRLIG